MYYSVDSTNPPQSSTLSAKLDKYDPASTFMAISQIVDGTQDYGCGQDSIYKALAGWIETYLSSHHEKLGRYGAVCPYTVQASRLDTLRMSISTGASQDQKQIYRTLSEAMDFIDSIPCESTLQHLRAVLVAFPNCQDADGIRSLQQVQKRLKYRALRHFKMIGLFHADNTAPGLWNPDFRPLQSPIPLIVIRSIVVEDTPFALRHLLLLPVYLTRFPKSGSKRILAHLRAGMFQRTVSR